MKKRNFVKATSLMFAAGGMLLGLTACGSNNDAAAPQPGNAATETVTAPASYIQATLTQPASPGSVFQSAMSETYDGLASSLSKAGSTASPDVSASVDDELIQGGGNDHKNCIAITTNPSPLSPNNMPSQYMIAWTYTNCQRRFGASTLSGTRQISVTNDSNDLTRTVEGSLALVRRYPDGAMLTEDNNSQIVDQGKRDDANNTITRTATLDGNAVFQSADGNDRYNHSFSHQLTLQDTFDPNSLALTQRVVNGTGDLHHNLIDAQSTVTYTNLTYDPQTCGWPVSGTLATQTTFKDGTVHSATYTYSLPCGTVTDASSNKINLSNN